jgi:NADH-quinone oxidoreductase subunit H
MIKLIEAVLLYFSVVVTVLLSVAVFTVVERKIMGSIQRRRGPNVVGVFGILQPFSDGIKLFLKELIIPSRANRIMFVFCPILALSVSLMVWVVLPFKSGALLPVDVGLLYVLALLSLNTYSLILGGWSSNSKYAFLGAMRAGAQMVSYEIAMGLSIMVLVVSGGSLNFLVLVESQEELWNVFVFLPSFFLFYICFLAETYRTPFDFSEAEGELVSGFNVEYSSMGFALFFIAEYVNIIFMCFLMSVLFFGGVRISVILLLLFVTVWLRSTLPRYRYDQLMRLGWRVIMPLSLLYFCIVCLVVYFCTR